MMRRLLAVAVLYVGAFTAIVWSQGSTYYVNFQTGSGSVCSFAAPCATLTAAQTAASPGDTVIVSGTGTTDFTATKSGTALNPITYRGYADTCPTTPNTDPIAIGLGITERTDPTNIGKTAGFIIQANYIVVTCVNMRLNSANGTNGIGVLVSANGSAQESGAHKSHGTFTWNYIEWDGTGTGCSTGIGITTGGSSTGPANMSTDNLVEHNYITQCSYGIYTKSTFLTARKNEVFRLRNGSAGGDMDYTRLWGEDITFQANYYHGTRRSECIFADCHIDCFQNFRLSNGGNADVAKRFTITGNVCMNTHQGILMQDVSLGNPGPASGIFDTVTVTNNLVAGGPLNSAGTGPDTSTDLSTCMTFNSVLNVTAAHNTCLETMTFRAGTTGTATNNIISVNSAAPLTCHESNATVTCTKNLMYRPGYTLTVGQDGTGSNADNIVNANPLFVDTSINDYRLGAGSPAIGVGADVGVTTDIYGETRTLTYDIGAFEGVGAPEPEDPLPTPTFHGRGPARLRR